MEGHCCECGDPIPKDKQRLTNGHLRCEFCSHPMFREPSVQILEEEHLSQEKTPPLLPGDWPELVPPTFEIHDPLPSGQSASIEYATSISRRPKCTCDAGMQELDPDWPGCCARCGGLIDRSEAVRYYDQVRKSALQNAVTAEKVGRGPIRRLLDALKPKSFGRLADSASS
jgi:hypothetical protein